MAETRLVVNGAGAAGIACTELLKAMGFAPNTVILCDTKGAIYRGRTEGMNQWKSAHAAETSARTLADALDGADAVFGLSAKGPGPAARLRPLSPTTLHSPRAPPGVCPRRGRRGVRPVGQGRVHGRDDPLHGAQSHHLRHGQSRPGDHA